jgi:hypothetical protein
MNLKEISIKYFIYIALLSNARWSRFSNKKYITEEFFMNKILLKAAPIWKKGRMDERKNKQTNEWMNEWIDKIMDSLLSLMLHFVFLAIKLQHMQSTSRKIKIITQSPLLLGNSDFYLLHLTIFNLEI